VAERRIGKEKQAERKRAYRRGREKERERRREEENRGVQSGKLTIDGKREEDTSRRVTSGFGEPRYINSLSLVSGSSAATNKTLLDRGTITPVPRLDTQG